MGLESGCRQGCLRDGLPTFYSRKDRLRKNLDMVENVMRWKIEIVLKVWRTKRLITKEESGIISRRK